MEAAIANADLMHPKAVSWQARQAGFALALLDPDIAMPDGLGGSAEGKPSGQAHDRFSIYRNNSATGLVDVLASAFPSVKAILGETNFRLVARNYILASPPASPLMAQYGEDFAGFLAGFPPLAASPWLADVARLERAWLDSYHARDEAALSGDRLARLSPKEAAGMTLRRHAAASLVRSRHPVHQMFEARTTWPLPGAINLDRAETVLVTRPGLEVMVTLLAEGESDFFATLFSGNTLAEAIDAGLAKDDGFDPAMTIGRMLSAGAFSNPSGT